MRKGMAINVNAVLKKQQQNAIYMTGHKRKGMITLLSPTEHQMTAECNLSITALHLPN